MLSWNVDGLNRDHLALRTRSQCDIILKETPDILLLQEVVSETEPLFKQKLGSHYRMVSSSQFFEQAGWEIPPFYQLMAWKKTSIKRTQKPQLERFSERGNHRHILGAKFVMKDCPENNAEFYISTSHFESSRGGANDRRKQLQFALQSLRDEVSSDDHHCSLSIFAGDTNLRDKEAKEMMGDWKDGIKDCWEVVCPSTDKETKYTWDTSRNSNTSTGRIPIRTRYDRMFFSSCQEPHCCSEWHPIFWSLIGTERLESVQLHPSDHFGICCTFLLFPSESAIQEAPQYFDTGVIDLT